MSARKSALNNTALAVLIPSPTEEGKFVPFRLERKVGPKGATYWAFIDRRHQNLILPWMDPSSPPQSLKLATVQVDDQGAVTSVESVHGEFAGQPGRFTNDKGQTRTAVYYRGDVQVDGTVWSPRLRLTQNPKMDGCSIFSTRSTALVVATDPKDRKDLNISTTAPSTISI